METLMTLQRINPPALGAPLGQYSHITVAPAGQLVFIAGQLSSGLDFTTQCSGVFNNIGTALGAAGSGWSKVAQFTTYLTNSAFIPEFMKWRVENFPRLFGSCDYPPNTLLVISQLVDPNYMIEVQTLAVS